MGFQIDKQTLDDLDISDSNFQRNSVIELFTPKSLGGLDKLRKIFGDPLTSVGLINQRISSIRYIGFNGVGFDIDKEDLDFIEYYVNRKEKILSFSNILLEKYIMDLFRSSNSFYIIRRGIYVTLRQLKDVYKMATSEQKDPPELIARFSNEITSTLEHPDFNFLLRLMNKSRLSVSDLHFCDQLFRGEGRERVMKVLDIVYTLDVLQSAATTAKKHSFSYPNVYDSETPNLKIEGLFHPLLEKPVSNDVIFENNKTLFFITGANMAGKSTFLKSIGISLFLAHLGFPVPARKMDTGVLKGLITSINISDNITAGHSHFVSEVERVKEVALAVKTTPGLFVIFDELFRGTNVKDAFDASKMIINAFSTVTDSLFIVSSHIVEVAHELTKNDKIDFKFLELSFNDDEPIFSYKIADGITEERIGLWIIKKAKILDILE